MTRKMAQTSARKSKPAPKTAAGIPTPTTSQPTAIPPSRVHGAAYHWPLLLEEHGSKEALLRWFEGVEESRSMPWRKKWIDPKGFENEEELASVLAKRAYEVWVSEVMLQQTRVSTVIPYFNTWISKWPTIQDLANAKHDDVLSVWKGLGYYSRATRLHEGAQAMISKNPGSCPIPSKADELQQFPGIGRYTAGAISSIAFGESEPVLDGNVARVLSRQLGLYIDVKDKKASDLIWDVADQLIKNVADHPNTTKSAIPGQWNQAVMELGSTVCTPRPKCDECPIQKTCRAYAEGKALSMKKQSSSEVLDIEDACSLCEQLDTEELVTAPEEDEAEEDVKISKKRKTDTKQTNMISNYFAVKAPSTTLIGKSGTAEDAAVPQANGSKKRRAPDPSGTPKSVLTYCSLFPKKVAKKKAAEEECVVCIIECRLPDNNSVWLTEQRPAKGLLASLWQFPSSTLSAPSPSASYRKTSAQKYVSQLDARHIDMSKAHYIAEFDSLVHVFSHLKLTMHVHHFRIDAGSPADIDHPSSGPPARKWVGTDGMDDETLSTGMRRCWELVKKSL